MLMVPPQKTSQTVDSFSDARVSRTDFQSWSTGSLHVRHRFAPLNRAFPQCGHCSVSLFFLDPLLSPSSRHVEWHAR